MKAEEYHLSLRPLEEACRLAESGWICLRNPLVGYGHSGSGAWKIGVLIRHVRLVRLCWKARKYRHILVREFSTVPLLFIFPLLFPLCQKLFFIINHNLQWTEQSRIERFALALLAKLGAHWVLFETQDIPGLAVFNIPSRRNLVFRHPVPFQPEVGKNNIRPVVGAAGYYRPEKGLDELIRLLMENLPDCDIIAGVPNPEAIKIPFVKVINTASEQDYRAMLARCDVLVQNGAKDSYFYRASGPVADAAAAGAAAVVPDFPLLRHQVLFPVPIGETFRTPDELPAAVRRAVERVRNGRYDFKGYCEARTAQAIADQLDEFSRRQNGNG